jgi:DNA gyrase inhibitor GyrI
LRLERAFFLLALMDDSIIDICRIVGFKRHETFSRSFKRRFRITPSEWRKRAQSAREQFLNAAPPLPRDRCQLSNVRFRSLRPAFLLAHRRVGDYASFDYAPFADNDRLWNPLVRWAIRHDIRYQLPAWGLTHDIPGITPPTAQRFDGCIRVDRAVSNARGFQCLRFHGGIYAVIDHLGERSTIMTAYSSLVHGIGLALDRYTYREGPSLTIHRRVRVKGDPLVNHTTVCIPVTSLIEQEASRAP